MDKNELSTKKSKDFLPDEHAILESAIKLYNAGKEQYTIDEKLAKKCIELSLDKLNKIKNTTIGSHYKDMIQTTEVDCQRLLNKTSENIFKLITVNDLNKIKEIQYINFREINSNGNTVLHHAIDIGDIGIIKELLKKGGLIDSVNGNGNTLLEYACLKKDPNIINFLVLHGASMEKHLFFRKGSTKYYLNKSDIDMAILLKLIITKSLKSNDVYTKFTFLEKYFSLTDLIGLDKFTIRDLLVGLHTMFNEKDSFDTYKTIILEELDNYEKHKMVNNCTYNKIDIILSNIIPFINYPFNVSSIFLIKNEIKFLIYSILQSKEIKSNEKEFKNLLLSRLFECYIQTNLFQEDYIGIIIYNILSKIKL